MTSSQKVRVRFAPSPTGHLHIGGVRTAMFNYLFARHTGGEYLLRIEDTDRERSKKEFVDSQLASLAWLDLLPDGEIVYQSQRIDAHQKAVDELLSQGKAYRCYCQPKSQEGFAKYNGTCRDKNEQDTSQPHTIRFKLPKREGTIEFSDAIRGKIRVDYDQFDDFIIVRSDGSPTYNFVVVIDDRDMEITHVVRGEDHISNTPKQIVLYEAFGATPPIFAHLPLIMGKSGQRLSKRDAATSVEEYKKAGFMANALFNYLVRLGWAHGDQEVFTRAEMIELFTLEKIGKKGAIFDPKKLEWLNGIYIREASSEELLTVLGEIDTNYPARLQRAWQPKQLDALLDQYKQRATLLVSLAEDICALAEPKTSYDASLIAKWQTKDTGAMLEAFAQKLAGLSKIDHDAQLEIARNVCEEFEAKLVQLAQPLRLALTGTVASPGIFELIGIVGKDEAINRINRLASELV